MNYIQLDPQNVVVSVTESSQPILAENVIETAAPRYEWLGYTYDRETDTATPPVEPEPVLQRRFITIGAFQRRIGVMTSFAINTDANEICVALRAYVATLRHVDLDDPDTAAMLGMLAINNLPAANPKVPGSAPITAQKIQDILSAPVQESERP